MISINYFLKAKILTQNFYDMKSFTLKEKYIHKKISSSKEISLSKLILSIYQTIWSSSYLNHAEMTFILKISLYSFLK